MPSGKKKPAEQIIPKLRVSKSRSGEVRICTGSSRCGHDTSRNRLSETHGLSWCTLSPSVPFPAATKASGCLSAPI